MEVKYKEILPDKEVVVQDKQTDPKLKDKVKVEHQPG